MKTFIVLGMHRSATSLVARGLVEAGVHMGEKQLGFHSSNPWGHYEDVDFISMSDRLLTAAGGSWDKPPLEDSILGLASEWGPRIKDFIEGKMREPLWGWKDPRTVLTIPLFLPYLVNPHFITCFRNPQDVAISLARRDRAMTRKKALALAKIYNDRLLRFLSGWMNDKYQL